MPEYGNSSSTPSGYTQRADVISRAVYWAKGIANDDSHQYVFGASHTQTDDGPNYDCTSFVSWAYRHGGLSDLIISSTGNMKGNFEAAGFTAIAYTPGMQLLCGDVLFYHISQDSAHAIMYTGNSNIVHAASKSAGIKEASFYGSSWQWVLRYKAEFASSSDDLSVIGGSPTYPNDTAYIPTSGGGVITYTGTSGITVYSDVRNSGAPNDRHDMTLREIAYWSDRNTFITEPTSIRISAINYTTLLGNLYDQFAQYYPNGYTADRSHFTGGIRAVMDFFADRGMSPAACAGFAASIFELSGIGTLNEGRGICNWEDSYKRDMHQKVEDWETNLTGQLEYLWQDLCTNYMTELLVINNFPVTDNGARLCANRFIVSYRYKESPQTVEEELHQSENAQRRAAEWFNKIIINPVDPVGTGYTSPTSVTIPSLNATGLVDTALPYDGGISTYDPSSNPYTGMTLTGDETTIPFPTPTWQYQGGVGNPDSYKASEGGLNRMHMRYSYWCNHFGSSSKQYKLGQIWARNPTSNYGIATLNNCYLVAVTETFGTVGDKILVKLTADYEQGTTGPRAYFFAIIADVKSSGDSNWNMYGHEKPYGTNVIEWQSVTTQNNRIIFIDNNSDSWGNEVSLPDTWKRQQVVSITKCGRAYDL